MKKEWVMLVFAVALTLVISFGFSVSVVSAGCCSGSSGSCHCDNVVRDMYGYHSCGGNDPYVSLVSFPAGSACSDIGLPVGLLRCYQGNTVVCTNPGGGGSWIELCIITGNPNSCCVATNWYLDADNDGYYTGSSQSSCSSPGTGWRNSGIIAGGDSNDNNAAINPGATEICNGIDDNCNGQIDEGGVCPATAYYCDADHDGYNSSIPNGTCSTFNCVPAGCTRTQGNDCNDTNAAVHPGATEICNGIDDNCNGQVDEGTNLCSSGSLCINGACVVQSQSRMIAKCNGTLPGNATFNDAGKNGNFTQINSSANGWVWTPASPQNFTYNQTAGDCHFNCSANFSWNPTNLKCEKVTVTVGASVCSDYHTPDACIGASASIARSSVLNSSKCDECVGDCPPGNNYNYTICLCAWNNTNNTCNGAYNTTYILPLESPKYGLCSWAVSVDNTCDTQGAAGKITTHYIASWSSTPPGAVAQDNSSCYDEDIPLDCPIVEKLPFFTFANMIIAIFVIVLAYMAIKVNRRD